MRRLFLGIIVAVIVAVLVGGTVALVLVEQHAPSNQVSPNTILPQCSTLTETPSPAPAGSGTLQFTCGTGPAFTSPNGGVSTVTFHNNATDLFCPSTVTAPCYTALGYIAHGTGTACDSGFLGLSNNTAITVVAGSYDYCGTYDSPPGGGTLPGFDIFWSG
jgi:hypothetical protein